VAEKIPGKIINGELPVYWQFKKSRIPQSTPDVKDVVEVCWIPNIPNPHEYYGRFTRRANRVCCLDGKYPADLVRL
jgi:hypothetical protein